MSIDKVKLFAAIRQHDPRAYRPLLSGDFVSTTLDAVAEIERAAYRAGQEAMRARAATLCRKVLLEWSAELVTELPIEEMPG